MIFETDRLAVRSANLSDVELFRELWTTPEVMKNVGFPQGIPVKRSELEERIQRGTESEFDELLVVTLKETGEAIGECKMGLPDEDGISETDVKLLPDHWGNKYGVEVKRGLVAHLFAHTNCRAVQATPNVNNIASIKMQEAVGGVREGEAVYEFPDSMRAFTTPVHHYIYRVYRSTWEDRQVR